MEQTILHIPCNINVLLCGMPRKHSKRTYIYVEVDEDEGGRQSKMAAIQNYMPFPRWHTAEPTVIYAVWEIEYGVKGLNYKIWLYYRHFAFMQPVLPVL